MKTTEELLAERAKTHGSFTVHARVTQQIKAIIDAESPVTLSMVQTEALHMIAHKIGRIVAGDPNFDDHWDDIAGYAKLCTKYDDQGSKAVENFNND